MEENILEALLMQEVYGFCQPIHLPVSEITVVSFNATTFWYTYFRQGGIQQGGALKVLSHNKCFLPF